MPIVARRPTLSHDLAAAKHAIQDAASSHQNARLVKLLSLLSKEEQQQVLTCTPHDDWEVSWFTPLMNLKELDRRFTPLMNASHAANVEAVGVLTSPGIGTNVAEQINIRAVSRKQQMAVHYAAGALPDPDGHFALPDQQVHRHDDLDERRSRIVEILADRGAVLDAKSTDGYTALHKANYQKLRQTHAALVAKGADPAILNRQGEHGGWTKAAGQEARVDHGGNAYALSGNPRPLEAEDAAARAILGNRPTRSGTGPTTGSSSTTGSSFTTGPSSSNAGVKKYVPPHLRKKG
jgi:hypothetical protein